MILSKPFKVLNDHQEPLLEMDSAFDEMVKIAIQTKHLNTGALRSKRVRIFFCEQNDVVDNLLGVGNRGHVETFLEINMEKRRAG